MRLQLSTWMEVEEYLKRCKGILIPIGSTEQHGPTGLIGTDAICPETIAFGAAEREEILVGPTINIGMAQHHLAFPGSITLRPSTLMAVLRDVIQSLLSQGFERIMFYNGHGGNIATTQAAFSEVYAEMSLSGAASLPQVKCRLINWFEGPSVYKLASELYGNQEGSHATPSEVSLSYFAYPHAVKQARLSPTVAPNGRFTHSRNMRETFPDGRCGSNPGLASVEHGERLYQAAIGDLLNIWHTFMNS